MNDDTNIVPGMPNNQNYDENRSDNSNVAYIINEFVNSSVAPNIFPKMIFGSFQIRDVAEHLVPSLPNGSNIPIDLVECLATKFRNCLNQLERVNHIYIFIAKTEIHEHSP